MPRATREYYVSHLTLSSATADAARRLLHAITTLATGVNPDGTPFHFDSGTPMLMEVVPDVDGERLPDLPCKYVVLKNQTGLQVQYGFAAGIPKFNLDNGLDERVNVDNANKLWIFDATASGQTFRAYAII
jgi:hypothetical protein